MSTQAPAKSTLRQSILKRLRALPQEQVQAYSAQLRARLIPELQEARHVCLYAPLPHEINLMPLMAESPERSYYFPRCLSGRRMSFHHVQTAERELAPAAMGIPEPLPRLPIIHPEAIDAIIVPGVAFTREGKRLGYGGGYYDRYLPLLRKNARVISLALPEQIVTDLPTDEHDCRIPRIITPAD